MYRSKLTATGLAAILALAIGCSRQSATPSSPSSAASSFGQTNAEGDPTLKVTAPTPISPINDVKLQEAPPLLTAAAATGNFESVALAYRFQVFSASGAVVEEVVVNASSYKMVATLDFNARYTWRLRAESGGAFGPWSSTASFVTPEGGYIRGNELYDPLYNGKTVGNAVGVTFIPGVGVRLNARDSVVEYQLPTTLTEGEFSAIITNLGNGSEDWKTKVMSMFAGDGTNVTDNTYRMTADKRTTWVGQGSPARYTFCVRPNCYEPNAGPQQWDRTHIYFWKFTWGSGVSRLIILDGGTNGTQKVNIAQNYRGTYRPTPHMIRLGSIGGRGGDDTNPGTTVRNVFVGPGPRPNFPGDN